MKNSRRADACFSCSLDDYGDEWHFQIEAIGRGRKEAKVRYPRLLKSVGEAPVQYPQPEEDDWEEE